MRLFGYLCLILVIAVYTSAEGSTGNTCTSLKNKIFDNLLEMMVDIKSGDGSRITDSGLGKNRLAFTALLSASTTLSGSSAVLLFENVILNRGDAYDYKTGLFRAPISGLYLFSATVMSHSGGDFHATIAKNGKGIANLYGTTLNGAVGSGTIGMELSKGDTVSVQHYGSSTQNVYGHGFSFFSGYYISE